MFPRSLLLLLLAATVVHAADPKAATFTTPEQGGADYATQGEYVGDEGGVQVIALGEGRFQAVGFREGLPGTSPNSEIIGQIAGQRDEATGKVSLKGDGWTGEIVGTRIAATHPDGHSYALDRTVRKSRTLGSVPVPGAKVLFDGTSVDAWENGRIGEEQTLRAGAKTRERFAGGFLHVEFYIPFKPAARGQERGNSGVYLQNRYEVQVLDSFGLKGENNECGGIYGIAKPLVNMCYPPLTWQTFDIRFEPAKYGADGVKSGNAKLTVWHNGILVHRDVEVSKTTTSAGNKEAQETGPISLQDHGNPVLYRNIWWVPEGEAGMQTVITALEGK